MSDLFSQFLPTRGGAPNILRLLHEFLTFCRPQQFPVYHEFVQKCPSKGAGRNVRDVVDQLDLFEKTA